MNNSVYEVSRDEYAGVVAQINPDYAEVEKYYEQHNTFIKIVSKNDKTVYSYEVFSDEKTVSYTLENAQKKAYPKLAEEIKAALKNEFENAFKL